MADSHARSVAKAVSWRVTGTLDTFVISWLRWPQPRRSHMAYCALHNSLVLRPLKSYIHVMLQCSKTPPVPLSGAQGGGAGCERRLDGSRPADTRRPRPADTRPAPSANPEGPP